MQTCPDDESIQAFARGGLVPPAREALEAHLEGCSTCRQVVLALLSSGTTPPVDVTRTSPAVPAPWRGSWAVAGDKFGRYVVLGAAGAGGQGKVYAAYDTTLDRKVALKFIAEGRTQAAIGELLAEAASMAKLNHPNVVTVYDAGKLDGEAFIAMELVEGETLGTWARAVPGGQRRSQREIIGAMAGAARGLAAAHAAGVIHRDVKPHNILIDGKRVLVTDFGLATASGQRTGPAGTPAYMAPEQWRGEKVDARADVFAFCVTLYQLLCGELPFAGESVQEIRENIDAGRIAPRPSGVKLPAHLDRLVRSGLALDPANRPASMAAIAAALELDPGRARRRVLTGGAVLLGVVTAFWGGGYLKASPERRCHAGAARIDGAWNAGRSAAVARRFASVGEGGAWAALERRLGQYTTAWRSLYGETCTGRFSGGAQSEAVLDLQVACLEGKRSALDAFTSALPAASARQLVVAAGAPLPDLAECALTARAGTKPLPSDPGQRARAVAIGDELGAVYRDLVLGELSRAASTGTRALAAAHQLGYEPLIAEALTWAGFVELARGNLEDDGEGGGKSQAARLFEQALVFAERGHDDTRRAVSARELVAVYTNEDRFAEAELWAELASGLSSRLGDPPHQRGALAYNLGWLRLRRGDNAAAKKLLISARDLQQKAHGPEAPDLLGPTQALCHLEDPGDEQLACYRRALAFGQAVLGPNHPQLAAIYNNLSQRLVEQPGTLAEGCAALAKARQLLEGVAAPRNRVVLSTLTNQALCLRKQRNDAAAAQLYRDLLGRTARLPSHRAQVREHYGILLLDLGQFAAAAEQLALSVDDRRALFGAGHESVAYAACNLADALVRAGQPQRAVQEMDAAIAGLSGAATPPVILADAHWRRGQALLALGRGGEARKAFEQSLAIHERLDSPGLDRALATFGLGQAEQALGHGKAAREKMERALALSPAGAAEPADRAEILLALAVLLDRTGSDEARTCALANEAVAGYRAASPAHAPVLRRAEALLDRLGRAGCKRAPSAS